MSEAVQRGVSAAIVLAALLACGRGTREEDSKTTVKQALPAVGLDASLAEAGTKNSDAHVTSAVVFRGDKLIACADLAIEFANIELISAQHDAAAAAVVADDLKTLLSGGTSLSGRILDRSIAAGTAAKFKVTGNPETLEKECGQQFSGRVIVGSCRIAASRVSDGGIPMRVALDVTHYDALAADKATKNCISARGSWQETPRDSLRFRLEHNVQALQELEQILKQ